MTTLTKAQRSALKMAAQQGKPADRWALQAAPYTLRALVDAGYLDVSEAAKYFYTSRRRLYAITDAGRAALK